MKGRTPTADEQRYINKVMERGCFCCEEIGNENPIALPHHTDGRTKPGSHYKIIPLCSYHHDYSSPIGVHCNKTKWEKRWGTQKSIVEQIQSDIGWEFPDD